MRTIETTGKTPEEAIEAALNQLGADRDEVRIDVVNQGRSGLLGIGSEPAVVRVTLLDEAPPDDDDFVDDEPQPAGLTDFAPPNLGYFDDGDEFDDDEELDSAYEDDEEVEEAPEVVKVSYSVLNTLLDKMEVSAEVYLKESHNDERGGPVFEIEGDDSGLLIGSRGETLRALQFIASFIVSRRLGSRTNMFVDVEGYQQRRYNSVANPRPPRGAARRAERQGNITGAHAPDERRQVHMALADRDDVFTESDGYGDNRRVVIHPD